MTDKLHQIPNWLIEQLPSKPLGQKKLLEYKKSQDCHPISRTARLVERKWCPAVPPLEM